MIQPLNDEQRSLVERNYDLIDIFLKQNRLSEDAVEDWYGTAAIGLCVAASTYDSTSGVSFRVYAYHCMKREVWLVRHRDDRSVDADISLDRCK